ncbi:MAG: 4a-hydroxytetrahydrobiopterin dehydratase [Nocardioides sp.]|nr:4a-hydroxytetrahydrobiopterin dehydratase [Nocardioides sp.]
MDMLRSSALADVDLPDWRKLAQGLHARFLTDGFAAGARFVTAVAEAADALGHHPRVTMDAARVDLELVSHDAIYRADDGTEHVVEWVTQDDVDLARRVSEIAAEHGLGADPAQVTEIELGLGTPRPDVVAPVWAAVLTGDPASQGRGTPGDEVRDATARVPNLWFDESGDDPDSPVTQRFPLEIYLPLEVLADRVAAAVAAGGTVVDDSAAPGNTVIADPDGNRAVLCVDVAASGGTGQPSQSA